MTVTPATQPQPSAAANSKVRLKSMTGYAQARAVENGWSLRVSIRAVNHRFLDLHLRVPEGFEPIEPRIRQMIRERIRRGHLDVTLHYELAGPAAVGVNQEVAAAYLQAMDVLRKQVRCAPGTGPGVAIPPARSDRIASGVARQRDNANRNRWRSSA